MPSRSVVSSRAVVSAVCLGVVVYAASSLRAKPMTYMVCCNDGTECSGGLCCDNVSIGAMACDPSAPGFCMDVCQPISGS